MTKTTLKENLAGLLEVLNRKNLSIDQGSNNGSYPQSYLFSKILNTISLNFSDSDLRIRHLGDVSNDLSLKTFNGLKMNRFIEKSLVRLNDLKADDDVTEFANSICEKIKRYRALHQKRFLKASVTHLLFLLVLFSFKVGVSQINIFDKDIKTISSNENTLLVNFAMADVAYSVQLPDLGDGSYLITSCEKGWSKDGCNYPQPMTCIGIKVNKNLFYTVWYSIVLDKNGFNTDYCYAGYIKREYGEASRYVIKTKKKRLYPENNIYTESISLKEIIKFKIEKKNVIATITLPNIPEFNVGEYSIKNCCE